MAAPRCHFAPKAALGVATTGARRFTTSPAFRQSPLSQQTGTAAAAVAPAATTTAPATASTASPLSVLPTSVLLRSLFINAVSSRSYLLTPSLYLLSKISQSNGFILGVDRNPLLRWIMKNTFYKQFCAGENMAETRKTMDLLQTMGFRGTLLTYAKETVFDFSSQKSYGQGFEGESTKSEKCPQIEGWRQGYLDTVALLHEGDQLAMKLSGAGTRVTTAFAENVAPPQQFIDALEEICEEAHNRKAQILIDAESQQFQWGIMRSAIDMMRKYNVNGQSTVYTTYQAYLKSTPISLRKHLALAADEGFTLGLKLVRGAYMASDPRTLIHDTKQDTDDCYNSITQGVLKQQYAEFGTERPFPSVHLFLASHNRESLVAAYETFMSQKAQGLPTTPLGFAQLHGMSDNVSFELLKMKRADAGKETPDMYKCSTWGALKECMAYLSRRAAENRDAAGRTADEYAALKTEVARRIGLAK